MEALFACLAPPLAEALGPTLAALGVTKRGRVDPKSGFSLRHEIIAWERDRGDQPSPAAGMIGATAGTTGLLLVTLDRGSRRLADFDGLDVVVL